MQIRRLTVIAGILISSGWVSGQGARAYEDIRKELQGVAKEVRAALSEYEIRDAAKRAEKGPTVIPLLKREAALMEEAANANPEVKETMMGYRDDIMAKGAMLGDKEAEAALAKEAAGADAKVAMSAKTAMLSMDWIKAAKDPAAQGKILDQVEVMAKASPTEAGLADLVGGFAMSGAASRELKDRATKIVVDDLKGPGAEQIGGQLAGMQKLRVMENKPLVLSGAAIDGKTFSSEGWKGKVILVDFWATWCGPCMAELPRVKKAYGDYHGKGLEVLGVSCDNSADDLQKFLAEDKAVAWPQLFDAGSPGWHPLAKKFGIEMIPTMFLIDKKGVLRSVEAADDFETEIPKLLAE